MSLDTDLSLRQFGEAWRLMCASSPNRSIATSGGLDYCFSGLPIPFFNIALLTGHDLPAEALSAEGHRACAWAAERAVPWMFIVTQERLAPGVDATAALDACGLAPLMPLTGMAADDVAPSPRVPDGLQLAVAEDDAGCGAILDVNAVAYGMDLEAAKPMVGRRAFWEGHVAVLGLSGGTPVSCAGVLMVDGYRYVAMVATSPDQQRRGFGDAVMRHALALSAEAHGPRPTVLHATEAGRPVYERMGYRTIANHTVFMEKRFLAEH